MSWRMKSERSWGRLGMRFNIWKDCPKVPITELLSFIVDNRGKTVPTADDGWKLIATKCVTNNTLFPVYEKVRYLTQETYETWFRAHPMPGDILFVNKGTPGRVCLVPDPVDFCIAQDMIALRADDEKIYNKYLFAVLRSREIQQQIYNTNVGDVIPHFKKQFMDQLLIPVPDRRIQEIIGNLYYELSYKTELNKKINKNLEQQAQAIFDDMFPDLFSLNTDATLQDLIVFANGKKRPKTIGNIPVYGGNGILAYTDKSNADNCVIIGRVGAYCGNTFLCLDKCWTSDNAIQAKSRTGSSPLFIYYLLRNASLSSRHIGTGQPLMTQGILNAIPIKYPVEEKISAFIETCSPIHKMISGNRQQNESLASIRDSMLPKLMSGEMDVSELNL